LETFTDTYPPRWITNIRGSYFGYFLGFWSRQGNPFNLTSEHRGVCPATGRKNTDIDQYKEAVNQFMDKTKNVWGMCRTIFEDELFDWYSKCMQIKDIAEGMDERLWFPWTGISLGLDHNSESHQDQNNAEGLVTCVVVFGDWKEGGDIVLEDYRAQIRLHPGDIYFFEGTKLWHRVKPFSGGERNVFTLYVDKKLLKNDNDSDDNELSIF
jgi:hypothetical protein